VLQAKHVMCAPIFDFVDVLNDPQYTARGFFRTTEASVLGEVTLPGTLFPGLMAPATSPPPQIPGTDNREVFKTLLELGSTQIDDLSAACAR